MEAVYWGQYSYVPLGRGAVAYAAAAADKGLQKVCTALVHGYRYRCRVRVGLAN